MSVRSDVRSGSNRHWEWRLDAGDGEDGKTTSDVSRRSACASDAGLIFADAKTDGPTKTTNYVLEGYLPTLVNYNQNDGYELLLLAEHAYNNSATNKHKIMAFFAKYSFHLQTEWMKERKAQN